MTISPLPKFLSTLSLRRATTKLSFHVIIVLFLSTLSLRRATGGGYSYFIPSNDFYPRSPCGERLYDTYAKVLRVNISIHALLAESDTVCQLQRRAGRYFYPRSPCGERRRFRASLSAVVTISIHALLAESDRTSSGILAISLHFYPRSPCGERRPAGVEKSFLQEFLSTLSLRRATAEQSACPFLLSISIHALLAESDCYSFRHTASSRHFYPRSPCGERLRKSHDNEY